MSIDFNDNFRAASFVDTPGDSESTPGNDAAHIAARGLIADVAPVAQDTGTGTISITTLGATYQQNFDSLSNTAGSTTNTALPAGWYITETGGGARDNEQYAVDTGGSTTGDIYSYGAAAATDRALGQLRSGTLIPFIGAQFTNNSGSDAGSMTVSYNGEQWRFGGVHSTVAERMDFQISFNATGAGDTAATWIDVNSLDFSPSVTAGTAGALNGNANQVAITGTFNFATALANGASFWIRWIDTDATGADDGLAIDDFSLSLGASTPQPGSLTVANASVAEGNSGDSDLVFTVTRAGGSAGAVSATWTITDGSTDATDHGTGFAFTGSVNFADGQTTAQIHVPIHGDTDFEPNETLQIALSSPTGGATLGAQTTATGTITNDDVAPAGTLSIADASAAEGDSGTSDMVFTVSRANGSAGAVDATWTISFGSGSTAADASDLGAGTPLTGTVHFADGATTAEIHVPIQGDTTFEAAQNFTVTLTNPTGGAALGDAVAIGTITNDDPTPPPANVFINEIHYDNSSTDSNEGVEIAGIAGTDLTGWHLVLYNGNGGVVYAPTGGTTAGIALTGVIPDQQNGYGTVSIAVPGLQNGGDSTTPQADGFALVDANGVVVQFLSYEGVMTATNGPASGMTSTDIGVAEEPAPGAGVSLQLTGAGSTSSDFSWIANVTQSYGAINSGQSFLSASGTSHLRVDDASVAEGDSGTHNLTFTVHRAGGQNAATSVGYTINLDGSADAGDLGAGAVLSGTVSFGIGEFTKTITVPVQGDTVGEHNETFHVTLGAPTGDAVVDRAVATATIVNDDPIPLLIGEIQGAGHTSGVVGQQVITHGIVTAIDSNGFYLQDSGDGNSATSDGIFVFTSTAPTVAVGDAVDVSGTVQEFQGDAAGLTVTQISSPIVTIGTHSNALPDAVVIGEHGILPPTQVIEDDGLTSYDPTHDGIDFWESLEGMRVTIETPQAVSNTNEFGETDVVASLGHGATGMNDRGGITISPNGDGTVDYNPEKIQIDDDSGIFAGFTPNYTIGDQLSDVTGILNYSHDNYEVLVTGAVTTTLDKTTAREVTALHGDATHLSIATYNLENLDASDNKYTILANDMMVNLGAPDIIAVQEVQDADGAGNGSDLSGASNAQGLIDAIFAQTGKHYAYIEIAPTVAGTTGGEPGGNIRNGYLYNVDRVTPDGSPELITGAAYNGSRNPLVQTWNFNGQHITTIDVHATSRGGSDEMWGDTQPPADAGDAARTAQAAGVKAWINDHLATDPNMNIAVLGDWNGFYFEQAQMQLTDPNQGGMLTNLNQLMTPEERYSYLFDGNAQQIDNILVTGNLYGRAQIDSIHINSQFAAANRPTDHDPQVAVFDFDQAAVATNDTNSVVANAAITNGQVLINDSDLDGPALSVSAVNGSAANVGTQITLASGAHLTLNADGTYSYDPNHAFDGLTGSTGAANSSAIDSFTYTLAGGGTATVTITITGTPGSTAPAEGTGGNDVIDGTANDDMFRLNGGGTDQATGGDGNDGFYFGAAFDPTDHADGGAGTNDQIGLQGDYSGGLTLGAGSMTDVEMLVFLSGSDTRFGDNAGNHYSYDVTTDDANVGAGKVLTVQGNALGAGENLTFDGSAETDGAFAIYGGLGTDHLTGGQKDDSFYFGKDGRFGASDTADGQGGSDQLRIQGDYSGANGIVLGVDQVKSVDLILLASAQDTRFGAAAGLSYSYDLKTDDTTVAAGETMTIQAKRLLATESLHFDGSAETDGAFKVYSGAGQDVIVGGAGADTVVAGAGNDRVTGGGGADNLFGNEGSDTFIYLDASDSTVAARDHILDFGGGDTIDVSATGLNDFIGSGAFSHHAGEVRATFVGSFWQIEGDTDGDGNADLSILVTASSSYAWSESDFVLAPSGNRAAAPMVMNRMLVDDRATMPVSDLQHDVKDGAAIGSGDIGHAGALPGLVSLAELHIL